MLPLSHDEVVHGKGSILGRMPGDRWQRFANLRGYYALMFVYPGKKVLFMGNEFGQEHEWRHDQSLDWHLLDSDAHQGIQRLIRDLNRLYCSLGALHEFDCQHEGFRWIDFQDAEKSIIAFIRWGQTPGQFVVVVSNFTPNTQTGYRVGVPASGEYLELFNSDAEIYGGSNQGNLGRVQAEQTAYHGQPCSLSLTLPPLATIVLGPEDALEARPAK